MEYLWNICRQHFPSSDSGKIMQILKEAKKASSQEFYPGRLSAREKTRIWTELCIARINRQRTWTPTESITFGEVLKEGRGKVPCFHFLSMKGDILGNKMCLIGLSLSRASVRASACSLAISHTALLHWLLSLLLDLFPPLTGDAVSHSRNFAQVGLLTCATDCIHTGAAHPQQAWQSPFGERN